MAFTGHIADVEAARRVAGNILIGQNILGVTAGNLTSAATAQAAATAGSLTLNIGDRTYAVNTNRAYQVASNFSATFGSTYAALYASLPDSANHQRKCIQG